MEADTPKLVSLAEEQVREFGFAQAMRADTTGWNFRQGPPVSGNRHPHGATDVRLQSDEPQADQHQYAG